MHALNDNEALADAAEVWFVRMTRDTPLSAEDDAQFKAWLDADPRHAQAYRQCQIAWLELGTAACAPEVLAMRSRALKVEAGSTRRRILLGLAGGGVAASIGGALWLGVGPSPARALITTSAGQRLTTPLPDGSEITLAPLTRVRLAFSDKQRTVILQSGQAYFEIAHDAARPFSVQAGDRVVTATGTRFQITLTGKDAEVVLEDGGVDVTRRGDPAGPVQRLSPGQRLWGPAAATRIETADVLASTAWREGRLVVRDRPLGEVVAAFNRYSGDRLVLGDPELAALRISGSFRYDGASEFALALENSFKVRTRPLGDNTWRIDTLEGSTTVQ